MYIAFIFFVGLLYKEFHLMSPLMKISHAFAKSHIQHSCNVLTSNMLP